MLLKKLSVRDISILAALIALNFVLTRIVAIPPIFEIVRLSFGFVPVTIMAMLYGPVWAGLGAVIEDILGATLLPTGTFHFGFTLCALLVAVVYGLFLYEKPRSNVRFAVAVLIVNVLIELLLKTYFLEQLLGRAYLAIFAGRIWQCFVMAPLHFLAVRFLHTERMLVLLPKHVRY